MWPPSSPADPRRETGSVRRVGRLVRRLVATTAGQVHVRDSDPDGADEAVLLMHINQRSSALMVRLAEVLAPATRVVALDHPSYGMSDHVAGPTAIADYARWAIEALDGLRIERVVPVGEAASALVAAQMVASRPSRVPSAVLVNCPSWADPTARSADTADLRPARPQDPTGWPVTRTVEWVLEHDPDHAPLQPTQEWMDLINRAQMEAGRDRWQLIDAMDAFDLAPVLDAIDRRVLLVWGEHFLYRRNAPVLRDHLAHVSEVVVAGGRFDLCFEHPTDVGRAILAFVAARD